MDAELEWIQLMQQLLWNTVSKAKWDSSTVSITWLKNISRTRSIESTLTILPASYMVGSISIVSSVWEAGV